MTRALVIAWLAAVLIAPQANTAAKSDSLTADAPPRHRGLDCVVIVGAGRGVINGTSHGSMPMYHPCSDSELVLAWREI